MKNRLLVFSCLFQTWMSNTDAVASSATAEAVILGQIATAMKVYSTIHGGERATEWEQIREVYKLDAANRGLRGSASYPFEDHYQFVAQRVPIPGYEGSEVLLIRTVPLQRGEGKPKFRYFIGRTKDGEITATHRSEEEIRAMFKQAGVPLPLPPPGLPAFEIEKIPDADEALADLPSAGDRRPLTPPPTTVTQTPVAFAPTAIASPAATLPRDPHQLSLTWAWVVGIATLLGAVVLALWRKRKGSA